MGRVKLVSLTVAVIFCLGSTLVHAKGNGKGHAKGRSKVVVCHEPPGNPSNYRTIRVGKKARKAHLGHGDSLGNCDVVYPDQVNLQILAINDFHGNIATSSGSFGGTGRADYLAANIQAAEEGVDNSIFVSAGDLIGASPLISALFHDEPTIEAMNLSGLDINAVGHHEFDDGIAELLRMQNGGAHPFDGDLDGDPFLGADFEFLAANVVVDATGETLFAPYSIRSFQGIEVAFIGMTLDETPAIVSPSSVAGLSFEDEVDTVNALVSELQLKNIEAIVVLLHEGGQSFGGQNDCGTGLTGPIAEIVPLLSEAVDLVITGHTNDEFVCEIDGKWVTMADNRGRLFTDIDVTLDRETRDMSVVTINNIGNLQAGVVPDPTVTALINKYDALSAPLANAVVGSITTDISETANLAGESALGDVIADAQLNSTTAAGFGDSVVAFMNPGGIRWDLIFATSGAEAAGEVTIAEAFLVQPFGNNLVTMDLTGAQIDTLLEQQWVGQPFTRILQVSEGFSYAWSVAATDGNRVNPVSIKIGGVMVDPVATYRVTVNSFLAEGGDNFAVLTEGTNRLGGELDLDALVNYIGLYSPVAPGPQDRITQLP
jgi:5'-nucleotidase